MVNESDETPWPKTPEDASNLERERFSFHLASEKVHKVSNEDSVLTETVDGKWPVSILCDGASNTESAVFAEWLAAEAMAKVSDLLRSAKTQAEVSLKLAQIFNELNSAVKNKRQELFTPEAASTLLVSFLFYPEEQPGQEMWCVAGVGDGSALILRENGEVKKLSSENQSIPGGVTSLFPFELNPYVKFEPYQTGDVGFFATDGFDKVVKGVLQKNKTQQFHQLIKKVAQKEPIEKVAPGESPFSRDNLIHILNASNPTSDSGTADRENTFFLGHYYDDTTYAAIVPGT